MNKFNLKQIAKWYVDKFNEAGKVLSKKKLHSLIYFSKGFYYVFQDESFFDASFIVSNSGVTCKELAFILRENDDDFSKAFNNESSINNALIIILLNFVYEKIGDVSDEKLSKVLKEDEILKDKNVSDKLSEDEISLKFRDCYLQDVQTNQLNITRNEIVQIISLMTYKKYDKAFKELAK